MFITPAVGVEVAVCRVASDLGVVVLDFTEAADFFGAIVGHRPWICYHHQQHIRRFFEHAPEAARIELLEQECRNPFEAFDTDQGRRY